MNAPELNAMALPLVLMSIAAPIGAVDAVYFHLWRFRLYAVPTARGEMVTHLVRGVTFAAGAYLLAQYRGGGAWFWLIGGLFAVDFVNNLVDTALEPRSRAAFGGLPTTEHIIHIVGATFAGAITISYFLTAWSNRAQPTELLSSRGTLPDWLILNGQTMAAGAALLTLVELGLFLHSLASPRQSPATA
jgi:hypothetical protein